MLKNSFVDRMAGAIKSKRSILNVGLDPQIRFIPQHILEWASRVYGNTFEGVGMAFLRFNREIISKVHPFVVSIKPQIAFYECYGHWGLIAYEKTIAYAKTKDLIVITDAKRGDGGDTARAYAEGFIGEVPMIKGNQRSPIRVDCLTIHGYIASSCVPYFVEEIKKYGTGAFVVDKTSFNPNSEVEQMALTEGISVWQALAKLVSIWGEGTEGECGYRNLGVVMGATYPEDASIMRQILPTAWFLIPGYGEQGGGSDGAVIGFNQDGLGGIVNSSRGIIAAWKKGKFACDPKDYLIAACRAAEYSRDDLNDALKRAGKLNW